MEQSAKKYVLAENIALRSWRKVPFAYYHRDDAYAKGLKKEEFELLQQCDGQQDIPDSPLLDSLLEKKLCHAAAAGERLTDWQKPIYAMNRYFPKMFWSITERCCYTCRHCYNWAENGPKAAEFTWEECQRLIDEAAACGVQRIKLTGGEPLMHPHFLDIVRAIHARGMEVEKIYTSGAFLTQEILDELHRIGCRTVFKIAFDGIGQHDWLHQQEGAEAKTIAAMKLCLENHFLVHAIINVHRRNIDTLLPTAKMLDEMGVQAMQILRTTESPAFRKSTPKGALSAREYLDSLLQFLAGYLAADLDIPAEIWAIIVMDPKQFWKDKGKFIERFIKGSQEELDRYNRPVCRSNRALIGLAADGELYPCLTMTGIWREKKVSFGNVKHDGLMDLLMKGDYIESICRTFNDLRQQNKECGTCAYFSRCTGGCRACALALTGDDMGKDPLNCVYQRDGYTEKIADVLRNSHEIV